ncbi:MAG: hypothetical protein PUJ35_05710, partial [Ruminococcus bromii]|nr:hypothetical protein [Ruminococcus bromii]
MDRLFAARKDRLTDYNLLSRYFTILSLKMQPVRAENREFSAKKPPGAKPCGMFALFVTDNGGHRRFRMHFLHRKTAQLEE